MSTIATARRSLNRAFSELVRAQGDPEDVRQAAEKGWRAAREAVYAVLKSRGITHHGGTLSAGKLGDFEANDLGRARDDGQPLTDGYSRALQILHGECFYEDRVPSDVKGELVLVGHLIDQAEEDVKSGGRPRRRRRAA